MNVFIKRYEEILGKKEAELLLKTKIKKAIRVNTLKISEKELVERLQKQKVVLEKIKWLDFGYFADAKFSLGATPEYLFGYYYLQEAASQLPVQVLNPDGEELVLDMAAAPGGKTTQIAQYMKNRGAIVAIDSRVQRLHALKNNLERLGVKNCIAYRKDSAQIAELGTKFDKILLDAPCSGNFVVDDQWLNKKTTSGIKERAELQKKLMRAAVSVLKDDGTLVYSTCSLEPEENEFVIDWALENLNVRLEKINIDAGDDGLVTVFGKKLNPEIKKCKCFWPHRTKTQGFFVAKLFKR